ncbi:hypothetical protein OF83DRAFT_1143795, partial [Amylostereum chailletii]
MRVRWWEYSTGKYDLLVGAHKAQADVVQLASSVFFSLLPLIFRLSLYHRPLPFSSARQPFFVYVFHHHPRSL